MKIFQLLQTEQQQFLVYLVLSAVVTLGTAVQVTRRPQIYRPFIGSIHPVLFIVFTSVLGGVLLAFLLARGWFSIFELQNLKGWFVASGLALLFAAVMIVIDSSIILPEDVNRPFPDSLLFYPTVGFVAEILFHVLPLTLLLFLATSLFKSLSFEAVVWPCIFLVALLEPAFQTWAGYSRPYPTWVMALIAVPIFLLNFTQLALFKRYDFVTMYSFRLVYYLLWHIVWGVIRLRVLF